jgi:cysteine desulfuration protein SufE
MPERVPVTGIEAIISMFRSVDEELRLQLLLDYARKMLAPPPSLSAIKGDDAVVHECMTPVRLWVRQENGHIRVYAQVGEEAPTVRGFISIIAHGYAGASARELAAIPSDLVSQLGLSGVIRMNRVVGLNAVIQRLRREAEQFVAEGVAP